MDSRQLPVIAVLTADDEGMPPGLDALDGHAELRHADSEAALRESLPGADILLVTDFRTDALAAAWDAADSLKWIHATSAGVDALMIPEVRDSDIPVTNASGIFDRSIAEYVLGAILMMAKDFPGSMALQRDHAWRHRDTERVNGHSVLVVGAGNIGRQIARLCTAVGMRVTGIASRDRAGDSDFDAVYASSRLPDLLPNFDYVVVAAPLTPQTEGLFDAGAFERMSPHARFINIGRGPIVVTDDLVEALQDGTIAGAVLDVFEEEPLPRDHPLWDCPNTVLTAHMAGDFVGWREALVEQFVSMFHRWRASGDLKNLVDKHKGYAAR
ncbi:MAG: D-2-hydroxyacid dehydrogenase [Gammaproteobacteria bacterium]|nr:D-2-hydroxyacid dehydrogenase [Gammaproteobacteria bacterium]